MSKIDFKSAAIGALLVTGVALGVGAPRNHGSEIKSQNDEALLAKINVEVRKAVAQGIKDTPKLLVDTIQGYMQAEQDRQERNRDQQAVSKKAEIANAT